MHPNPALSLSINSITIQVVTDNKIASVLEGSKLNGMLAYNAKQFMLDPKVDPTAALAAVSGSQRTRA